MTVGALNRVDPATLPSYPPSANTAKTVVARAHDNNPAESIVNSTGSDVNTPSSNISTIEKAPSSDQKTKADTVEISSTAQRLSKRTSDKTESNSTSEQDAAINKLKAVDREVRAHERAHLAAAGGLARGGASFKMTRGPDGHFYAVAGEVQIDTSPVPGDPEATIRKAEAVRKAALAPAKPSSQDSAVAAAAGAMEAEARAEKMRSKDENGQNKTESTSKITLDSVRKINESTPTEPGKEQRESENDSKQDEAKAKLQKQFNPTEALGTILSLIA